MYSDAMADPNPTKRTDWGDYVVRVIDGPDPLWIWGYIPTLEEVERIERSYGAEGEELQGILRSLAEAHENGYRYGRYYSIIEPEGELGSAPDSVLTKTPERIFRSAQRLRFDASPHSIVHLATWPSGSFSPSDQLRRQ